MQIPGMSQPLTTYGEPVTLDVRFAFPMLTPTSRTGRLQCCKQSLRSLMP